MPEQEVREGQLSKKNLVVFVVEGKADMYALQTALKRLYDKIDESIEVKFIAVGEDPTTEENTFNIENNLEEHLQNDRAIFEQLRMHPENSVIIQITDADGVFIDNKLVEIDKQEIDKLNVKIKKEIIGGSEFKPLTKKYEDKRIACINAKKQGDIRKRNFDKSNNLRQLCIKNEIKLLGINNSVAYSVYYFSANLDHFLPSRNPNFGPGKIRNARLFAERDYRRIEEWVKYFTDDENSSTHRKMSFKDSWDFLKQRGTTNSLARGTNLDILIKNLYLEASLANAVKAFEKHNVYNYEVGSLAGLCSIHQALYEDLSHNAGKTTKDLKQIELMPETDFDTITKKCIEMLKAKPFSVGNGPTIRIWYDMMLRKKLSKIIAWSKIEIDKYLSAEEKITENEQPIKKLFKAALTNRKDDLNVILEGLKQSYCFEGFDTKLAIRFSR